MYEHSNAYLEEAITNNNKFMKKYLGSSKNPDNISLTVKSVLVWLIPAIILIAGYFGLSVAEADLTEIINSISVLVASAMTLYGLGRKAYYKYFV